MCVRVCVCTRVCMCGIKLRTHVCTVAPRNILSKAVTFGITVPAENSEQTQHIRNSRPVWVFRLLSHTDVTAMWQAYGTSPAADVRACVCCVACVCVCVCVCVCACVCVCVRIFVWNYMCVRLACCRCMCVCVCVRVCCLHACMSLFSCEYTCVVACARA